MKNTVNNMFDTMSSKGSLRNCIISIVTIALICIITTSIFLSKQSIWVDETTQLSGLTLNPVEVWKWLLGHDANRFGVPPDRMPPLSYWLGWSWAQIFGLTETAMRLFGVLCTVLSSLLIFVSARKAFGLAGAILAGTVFALSPNIIDVSVEIRAYSLFLLFASGAFFSLIHIIEKANKINMWYFLLALFCIAAIYTHFFGLIMSGSLILALLLISKLNKRPLLPIIITGVVVLISFAGVIPFVLSAVQLTGDNSTEMNSLYSLIRLVYRLFTHASIQVNVLIMLSCLLSAATLLVVSLFPKKTGNESGYTILFALGIGFSVISVASFIFSGFLSAQVTYNIWMLPGICILFASVLQVKINRIQALAVIAGILYVMTTFYSTVQFLSNATKFSNSPYNEIKPIIEQFDQKELGIVFDTDSTGWGGLYFPIVYDFGQKVQLFSAVKKKGDTFVLSLFPHLKKEVSADNIKLKHIMILKTELQSSRMTIDQIKNGDKPLGPGRCEKHFMKSKSWQLKNENLYVTMISADISVFSRTR